MFEPALGIERLGTIKEISALAGVAESTVHRALKDRPKLSPSTRARVMWAVRTINAEKINLACGGSRRNE